MRESGYYWCLDSGIGWITCYWNGDFWEVLPGQDYCALDKVPDRFFMKINETRIKNPDEK
jgi:hypothetical protein